MLAANGGVDFSTLEFRYLAEPGDGARLDYAFSADAGRVLLEADLRRKQTVAGLIHPDTELGAQMWAELEANGAGAETCFSFRQWIVPGPTSVYEDGLYILDAPLDEDQPIAPNQHEDGSDNPQGRALNRRVEISFPRD